PFGLHTGYTPGSLLIDDFDRDSHLDLALYSSAALLVYLGDGSGVGFTLRGRFFDGQYPFPAASGDFDLDGFPDLAVTMFEEEISIVLNDGTGSFELDGSWDIGPSVRQCIPDDLDQNCRPDLLFYASGTARKEFCVLPNETAHGFAGTVNSAAG